MKAAKAVRIRGRSPSHPEVRSRRHKTPQRMFAAAFAVARIRALRFAASSERPHAASMERRKAMRSFVCRLRKRRTMERRQPCCAWRRSISPRKLPGVSQSPTRAHRRAGPHFYARCLKFESESRARCRHLPPPLRGGSAERSGGRGGGATRRAINPPPGRCSLRSQRATLPTRGREKESGCLKTESDEKRTRRERVRQNAYRCVGAAARNRQRKLRPSSPLRPVVTRRMRKGNTQRL